MAFFDFLTGGRAPAPRNRRVPTFSAASLENPSTPLGTLAAPGAWFTEGVQTTGPSMTERTSMSVSAVFRCVSLIAGTIASLPLNIYQETEAGGRQIERNHRLYPLFHHAPDPAGPMSAFTWREMWGINTLLWGNHYSAIRYDRAARVIGFQVFAPWFVGVLRSGGRNVYRCEHPDGTVEYIDQEDMLHIPGIGFDGIVGQSRIRAFAQQSVGVSATLLQQMGRVHENAMRPSGSITVPSGIGAVGLRRIREWYEENHAGRMNAGKPLILDGDSKYQQIQMSPEDLNTIAAMRYQNSDIARFFGVPPHMIGETDASTSWGSGIEQLTIGFRVFTLEPELQRIEHELNNKLLRNSGFFLAFDRDALLAMDQVAMATTMQTRINSGLLTPNEGRRQLRLPDVKGASVLMINSTMIPLDRAVKSPPPPPPPAPPAPAPAEPTDPAKQEPKP